MKNKIYLLSNYLEVTEMEIIIFNNTDFDMKIKKKFNNKLNFLESCYK